MIRITFLVIFLIVAIHSCHKTKSTRLEPDIIGERNCIQLERLKGAENIRVGFIGDKIFYTKNDSLFSYSLKSKIINSVFIGSNEHSTVSISSKNIGYFFLDSKDHYQPNEEKEITLVLFDDNLLIQKEMNFNIPYGEILLPNEFDFSDFYFSEDSVLYINNTYEGLLTVEGSIWSERNYLPDASVDPVTGVQYSITSIMKGDTITHFKIIGTDQAELYVKSPYVAPRWSVFDGQATFYCRSCSILKSKKVVAQTYDKDFVNPNARYFNGIYQVKENTVCFLAL